jgi:hypothetical protein
MFGKSFGGRVTGGGCLALCAALFHAAACCPDEPIEICHTVTEWKTAPGCVAFPEAPDGVCPDAKTVAASCHNGVESARMVGNQCCYELPPPACL